MTVSHTMSPTTERRVQLLAEDLYARWLGAGWYGTEVTMTDSDRARMRELAEHAYTAAEIFVSVDLGK